MEPTYDKSSPESILEYALKISGKSLAEVVGRDEIIVDSMNKGDLGNLIELHYFHHSQGNSPGPDFPEAGVELKTTGLKRSGTRLIAKENLVLSMIDYNSIAEQVWESATLLDKCRLMLIMFYLFEKDVSPIDRKFIIDPILFSFPEQDMRVIRNDWETIRSKIRDGRAHEISAGDTLYLCATRKGRGGPKEKLREQPYSDVGASARAFALKAKYVTQIISGNAIKPGVLQISEDASFEGAAKSKFIPYFGKSVDDIAAEVGYQRNGAHKAFKSDLIRKVFGVSTRTIPEFEKADIEIKTVVLSSNGKSKEAMSFPNFKYVDIVNEKWEDTAFFQKLQKKFFLVVFRLNKDGQEILERVGFWNMPYRDRKEAKLVWEKTRANVMNNNFSSFPRSSENRVAHVRNKAKNAMDFYPTEGGGFEKKRSFWLNASYVTTVVSELQD